MRNAHSEIRLLNSIDEISSETATTRAFSSGELLEKQEICSPIDLIFSTIHILKTCVSLLSYRQYWKETMQMSSRRLHASLVRIKHKNKVF